MNRNYHPLMVLISYSKSMNYGPSAGRVGQQVACLKAGIEAWRGFPADHPAAAACKA
jgi:hypothetical protein